MSRVVVATRSMVLMFGVTLPAMSVFGQASFQGLGDLPGDPFFSEAFDVSADGSVVVGHSYGASGYEAFRWTAETGLVGLGDQAGGLFSSIAYGVSADGSVIVGAGRPPGGLVYEAFRWTEETGMVGLGFLPGESFSSMAFSVSSDGSVVVGRSRSNALHQNIAFRWTKEEGMIALGILPSGLPAHEAWGVSDDGTVVIGSALVSQTPPEAFRWTEVGGIEGLGFLPGGFSSDVEAISADGTVAYGSGTSAEGYQPLRWTAAEGLVGLGVSQLATYVKDASADGSILVGWDIYDTDAIIWDRENAPRLIKDVLVNDYGLDLTGWWVREAWGISADGTTIVGRGTNPDGNVEGWIAHLPPPPTIVSSDPPDGIIDARQDFSTGGLTRRGYDRVRLRFATAFRDPVTHGPINVTNFSLVDSLGTAPDLVSVVPVPGDPTTFDIIFEDPINPGAWSTLSLAVERPDGLIAEASVTIGFLPADADGSGKSAPSDILRLIDHLNGIYDPPMELWQCDIDCSGVCGPPDILRLIDLLNGVNTSQAWLNASLPPRPE